MSHSPLDGLLVPENFNHREVSGDVVIQAPTLLAKVITLVLLLQNALQTSSATDLANATATSFAS